MVNFGGEWLVVDGNGTAQRTLGHPEGNVGEIDGEGALNCLIETSVAPCRFARCAMDSSNTTLPARGLPQQLKSASASRLACYTAGRCSAARALWRLGLPEEPPGYCPETQLPLWPRGVLGSITHTRVATQGGQSDGQIVAGALVWRPDETLSPEGYALTFGLDAEGIMAADRARRLGTRLGVGAATGLPSEADEGTIATLVFSLKEAAFKATSLSTGLACGLGDLVIEPDSGDWGHLDESAARGESGVTLSGTIALRFSGTKASLNSWADLRAWYWVYGDVVWTAAAMSRRSFSR